jgi:hypothetical protein
MGGMVLCKNQPAGNLADIVAAALQIMRSELVSEYSSALNLALYDDQVARVLGIVTGVAIDNSLGQFILENSIKADYLYKEGFRSQIQSSVTLVGGGDVPPTVMISMAAEAGKGIVFPHVVDYADPKQRIVCVLVKISNGFLAAMRITPDA